MCIENIILLTRKTCRKLLRTTGRKDDNLRQAVGKEDGVCWNPCAPPPWFAKEDSLHIGHVEQGKLNRLTLRHVSAPLRFKGSFRPPFVRLTGASYLWHGAVQLEDLPFSFHLSYTEFAHQLHCVQAKSFQSEGTVEVSLRPTPNMVKRNFLKDIKVLTTNERLIVPIRHSMGRCSSQYSTEDLI